MTESEAIAIIKKNYPKCCKMVNGRYEGGFDDTDCELGQAFNIAIKALTELQQYRAIGTLEECRTAREKQITKKPYHISQVDDNDNANVECPACHATADYAVNVIKRGHCWKCGQLLDWSDDNETN